MKRIHNTNEIIGTSKKGSIEIEFDELIKTFGEPDIPEYSDGKVQVKWIFKIGGAVITIYDYKSSVSPEQNTVWSIGGNNHYCPRYVKEALDSVDSFYVRITEESFRNGKFVQKEIK